MKRDRTLLFVAAVSFALLAGCGGGGSGTTTQTDIQNVNSGQLLTMIEDGQPLVLADVRTEAEYDAGPIPGSQHLPLDDIATWSQTLDPQVRVCCICQSGGRSLEAARFLAAAGFEQVYNLDGAMSGWEG